ncbi:hypothetical protein IWX90DRAFT_477230 [Phyllosticta citrichinensis]|uniref:RING-type domain-containing protein n=1 Tax=Phyllosticta citrichinensis TaxID=1130410 RepID=A0ABR1XWY7_9PEZI
MTLAYYTVNNFESNIEQPMCMICLAVLSAGEKAAKHKGPCTARAHAECLVSFKKATARNLNPRLRCRCGAHISTNSIKEPATPVTEQEQRQTASRNARLPGPSLAASPSPTISRWRFPEDRSLSADGENKIAEAIVYLTLGLCLFTMQITLFSLAQYLSNLYPK